MLKKILKILLIVIAVIALFVVGFVTYLSVNEFNPEPVTSVSVTKAVRLEGLSPVVGQELNVVSWNIGYAGLGEDSDFFMDGGEEVAAADRDTVSAYLRKLGRLHPHGRNGQDLGGEPCVLHEPPVFHPHRRSDI